MKYIILIKEFKTEDTVETMNGGTVRSGAERLERGININLDHNDFYTVLLEEEI